MNDRDTQKNSANWRAVASQQQISNRFLFCDYECSILVHKAVWIHLSVCLVFCDRINGVDIQYRDAVVKAACSFRLTASRAATHWDETSTLHARMTHSMRTKKKSHFSSLSGFLFEQCPWIVCLYLCSLFMCIFILHSPNLYHLYEACSYTHSAVF